MYKLRRLGFLLGAAAAAACVVLIFPAPCPCGTPGEVSAALSNGTTQVEPSEKNGVEQYAYGEGAPSDDLAELLRRAATEDSTLILTFINEAWSAPGSLLDVFLESFHAGDDIERLLSHLVVVAVDAKAFDRCKQVHPLCYMLTVGGTNFTGEKSYMTKDYLDMMWTRNKFQTRILEMGYNFLFTDVDIIWFRNPFTHISVAGHITISSDVYYGDPYDVWKNANGGFLYAKSCKRTIEFFKNWHEARKRYPGEHDQYVFDKIKYELSSKFHVKIQFVDTAYLGGFCQPKKDFTKLCTFHANCRVGLAYKLLELKNLLHEWRQYRAQGGQSTNSTL